MKILLINLLCSILLLQSCNKGNKQMNIENKKNFSYAVTFSAATGFTAEVHEGYLADENKKMICGVPKAGMEEGPWQYDGAKAGQGGNIIPSYIDLTYVAYAEKKFYRIEGALPKDKILAAFQKGFKVKGNEIENGKSIWENGTYDEVTIGAAPGGIIVVWLSGNHHRTEICRLQAKETTVDVNDFYDNPHNRTQQGFFDELYKISISDSIKTVIEKNGIPYGLWDKYREKYNYRFRLHPYDEKDTFDQIYRLNYNGESEYLIDTKATEIYKKDAIPYNVVFMMQKYSAEIGFNDEELMVIFEKFKEKHSDKPIEIVLVPSFMYKDIKVYAECDSEKVELKKVKVIEIWGG
ncbi:DUF2931 family protein [Chryseobacterium gwangjuense]|uniref:DUF2931 family protein n=1 Tax=Chryseobacterium gwangjuense TaxID=1069980 RepID=UPI001E2C8805|nr:DUF2931 family protein [Chryseobacterium gwangjuense]MCE3074539.1 DUF2931 family protein [Chryseobacterium gwangjuense]